MENEILNNLINYVTELQSHQTTEEKLYFWKNVIGMTDEQIKKYEIEI